MAYVGLNHLREARDFRGALAAVASPSIIARSALIAMAAAAAILALSDSGATVAAGPQVVATKKADRLAPPRPAVVSETAGRTGFVNDPAAQTTTVMRGAAVPLGAASPIHER